MFSLLERIGEFVWGPSVERDNDDAEREKEQRELSGRVTSLDGAGGTVDHSVYFDLTAVVGGVRPRVILQYCIRVLVYYIRVYILYACFVLWLASQ